MRPSEHFRALTRLSDSELEKILAGSAGPAPELLAGHEFAGFNVPWHTRLLGIQKFIKGFFRGPQGFEGYNIPAVQNGIDGPWLHKPKPEATKRFGFFRVAPVDPGGRENFYPKTLLFNYGTSARNAFYRPERVLRDYVVQPDPKNRDLFLGKAYLAIGPSRVFSNFFIIERLAPTAWPG